MKQKQEQLQKLREKLLNLIKIHPNSQDAAKWTQMLAEIGNRPLRPLRCALTVYAADGESVKDADSSPVGIHFVSVDDAWADISGSVEERKQHLEQSNKNLDVFQTGQLQLAQWLSEKELMMSVLGPLSIDPNMLKMQKQQVQVGMCVGFLGGRCRFCCHIYTFFLSFQILQNEFKSRKPQYEQLEEAAAAILRSSGDEEPSSGKLVREQLSAVTQKWDGLIGQLDQRDSLIDQAAVKTGQFQELLTSLSQSTAQLESQLASHQPHSTQPDAVKKQLEDVRHVSAQLSSERKNLKEAEGISAELRAMVTEEYLKADLARQLESVSRPFRELEEKAGGSSSVFSCEED